MKPVDAGFRVDFMAVKKTVNCYLFLGNDSVIGEKSKSHEFGMGILRV